MKVTNGQQAPDFSVDDLFGEKISLKNFVGQKIHLIFYRVSGCAFCNLRFHQIDKLAETYKKSNVKLISIYESTAENMLVHMDGKKYYAVLIPNSDSSLYKLYELERSKLGLFIYFIFKGGIFKAAKGNKLFSKKVKIDGPLDRIGAEFLIDKNGKVENAFYGKTPGDFLPLEIVKTFIEN